MKKTAAIFASIFLAMVAFAQTNLGNASADGNQKTRSANSGFAEEEFRRGVQSYYRGAFNESIMEFEKALSYLPGEPLVLDWLGKAYYRSGIEGAALQQWNYAIDSGYGGILLQNRVEVVGNRRITEPDFNFNQRYTESGSYPNVNGSTLVYSQPVSSLSNPDGSVWVVAYGSNEILKFNVNGVVVKKRGGPVNGFDRPMDMIRLKNGNLAVSEFAGDRISILNPDGEFIKYIGKKGRRAGELVGPQYLAEDEFGNIYVTEFGNNRVSAFDSEGKGLFHFGEKTSGFQGLKSPTGIAVIDGRVLVADSILGGIHEFDRSGNYIGAFVNDGTFVRPESLKPWGGHLLVTDKNKVFAVDVSDGSVYENSVIGNGRNMITSAAGDRNGNIIVTDFKENEIYVMSRMKELVGGFYVQFERVIADNFPEVTVEVRVENRMRQPVVGLEHSNFFISEGKKTLQFELTGQADNNDVADITVLIDRSLQMKNYEDRLNMAVREIISSMDGKGTVTVISAGTVPVQEFKGNPSQLSDFSAKALKCPYSANVASDLAIRLASNGLINGEKKRGIIFITAGESVGMTYTQYSLSNLTDYMNNNAISFSTIQLTQSALPDETAYITNDTMGKTYFIYRPEGLSGVYSDIVSLPSGLYQLKYVSGLSTEYGRKYLPVEVEAYLLNRSGRDETGYFAPLQ